MTEDKRRPVEKAAATRKRNQEVRIQAALEQVWRMLVFTDELKALRMRREREAKQQEGDGDG